MGPRNYFRHVIEAILDFGKASRIYGDYEDAAEADRFVKLLLDNAVCWHLSPEVLRLALLTDLQGELFEKIRLPYPIMVLEYDFDELRPSTKKRCTIALQNEDSIGFRTFFYHSTEGYWYWVPYTPTVAFEELPNLADRLQESKSRRGVNVDLAYGGPLPTLPIRELARRTGLSVDEWLDVAMKETNTFPDIKVVFSLLQLLACHNAPDTVIIEPPEKLNKKRAKQGKVPIPRYRTLHIPQVSAGGGGDGTHSPKSTHYRRGHIRQQWYARKQEHRAIWVAPMIINAHLGEPDRPKDVEVRE